MDRVALTTDVEAGNTLEQLAAARGVSVSTVRYWMRKFGLRTNTYRRTWTDAQLVSAVAESRNIGHALALLGLDPRGLNYRSLKRAVRRLSLSTAHWVSGHRYSRAANTCRSDAVVFCNSGRHESGQKLRRRLIAAGLIKDECAICHAPPIWQGRVLVLRLDHINGDPGDHTVANLRTVCPNCDSQLPTFCGRNKRRIKDV